MKILVTGGTGFIGSHLVERLLEAGHEVRVLARPASDAEALRRRGAEVHRADLCGASDLAVALRGVEVVHHLAARVSDWGDWSEFAGVAISGTRRLLEAAERSGVRRFVLMSSASVYGLRRLRGRTVTEELGPSPRPWRWDGYGRAKMGEETLVLARRGALEVVVLRPTLVYGPRDRIVLPRLAGLLRRRRLRLIGSGDNRIHVIYVGDVVEAALAGGLRPGAAGGVFHLDGGERVRQREFLCGLADLVGAPPPRRGPPLEVAYAAAFLSEAWGRLRRSGSPPTRTRYLVAILGGEACFDTSRAERVLGWRASVGLREGLARTAAWWHGEAPRLSGSARCS